MKSWLCVREKVNVCHGQGGNKGGQQRHTAGQRRLDPGPGAAGPNDCYARAAPPPALAPPVLPFTFCRSTMWVPGTTCATSASTWMVPRGLGMNRRSLGAQGEGRGHRATCP